VSRPRRWRADGRLLFAAVVALVIGVPLGVSLIDTAADQPSTFSVVLWAGWIVGAALGAIVIIHGVQRLVSAPSAGLALAYDALPILLVGAWVLVVPSLVTGHWLLAAVAGGLCAYHLHLVLPRFRSTPTPSWVATAPTFTLCVANVFIDNPTPDLAARALIEAAADVLIIVESTPSFMAHFDAGGGRDRYPHRIFDPDDTSDYAVTIATLQPLAEGSRPETHGDLRVMRAVVPVDQRDVTVMGINPMATVDPGGFDTWRAQLRALRHTLAHVHGPLVLAGDLNTSRYRPEFSRLLATGLTDAHDDLGRGLAPSFKLSATGVLAAIGPVARLDHALTNHEVHPVEVVELEANGSDHLPFIVTLAVRPARRTRRHRGDARRMSTASLPA